MEKWRTTNNRMNQSQYTIHSLSDFCIAGDRLLTSHEKFLRHFIKKLLNWEISDKMQIIVKNFFMKTKQI